MLFILNPFLVNIFYFACMMKLFFILKKQVIYIQKRSADVYQFKIHHKALSIMVISLYIIFIIIGLHILRIYNMPHMIELKRLWHLFYTIHSYIFKEIMQCSLIGTFYLDLCFTLIIAIIMVYVITLHKLIFKEFFKWFIFLNNNPHRKKNILMKLFNALRDLGHDDIVTYASLQYILAIAHKTIENNTAFSDMPFFSYMDQLSFYHRINIIKFLFISKYYRSLKHLLIPILFFYDCCFNNFVVTAVFYYLLFYIPLRLLQRMSTASVNYAPYISDLLWNIYYNRDDCIYALAPNMKLILDNYLLSNLMLNPDLGINLESEIYIKTFIRFEPMENNRNFYTNLEAIVLHTEDNINFFSMIEDDHGNLIKGEKWILLSDKRKYLITWL